MINRSLQHGAGQKRGFTFVELLIYIGFLSMFLTVMINCVVLFTRSWSTIRASRNLNTAAVSLLERMTRDIRNATAINTGSSTFGVATSTLSITTKDDAGNFVATSYRLNSSTNKITISQNGVEGPLTPSTVTVNSFTLYRFTTAQSDGVRIIVSLTGTDHGKTATQTFYTTALLRGQYKN
jgi:type II secretory pathway pseudopilin PulG